MMECLEKDTIIRVINSYRYGGISCPLFCRFEFQMSEIFQVVKINKYILTSSCVWKQTKVVQCGWHCLANNSWRERKSNAFQRLEWRHALVNLPFSGWVFVVACAIPTHSSTKPTVSPRCPWKWGGKKYKEEDDFSPVHLVSCLCDGDRLPDVNLVAPAIWWVLITPDLLISPLLLACKWITNQVPIDFWRCNWPSWLSGLKRRLVDRHGRLREKSAVRKKMAVGYINGGRDDMLLIARSGRRRTWCWPSHSEFGTNWRQQDVASFWK